MSYALIRNLPIGHLPHVRQIPSCIRKKRKVSAETFLSKIQVYSVTLLFSDTWLNIGSKNSFNSARYLSGAMT